MKKQIFKISILFLSGLMYAQEAADIVMPKDSPFQLGGNTEGVIQNSVNESTGKVAFSTPLTKITANNLSYPVSLSYNGGLALKTAKNTNEYNPTGVVGLGFDMVVPKIIADYKGTATVEDDTYYLHFGGSNKLICTDKSSYNVKFKAENYNNWDIFYDKNSKYWTIIKEDGVVYRFGASNNRARAMISTWGNWIGDSTNNPTGSIPIEWYLYSISDQWNNQLNFVYEKVEGKQNTSQKYYFHTEAMYIKEINSTGGSKIVFTYGDKLVDEYFEPHTEKNEPDAYQEKYDKKYLQRIESFNSNDKLIHRHTLIYETLHYSYPIDAKQYRRKRYLKEITEANSLGVKMPSQKFDYHTSGDFNGSIDLITYPMGGSVKYNYTKKNLFYNGPNSFTGTQPNTSNYTYEALCVKDGYTLKLFRAENEDSGGKYQYKVIRYQWIGSSWIANEFLFPKLIKPKEGYEDLDEMKMVFRDGFYGFLFFDRATDKGDLYLFSLDANGNTWNEDSYTNIDVYAASGEDPVLLTGNNFVAVAPRKGGLLYTYVLKNNGWATKTINQNGGEYFYGATNNFILSLNEDGGVDMVTNNTESDVYYLHYLDLEQNWQTKSWTSIMLSNLSHIVKASRFYPNNSMAAFVADSNPEYFLRWNTNYNLIGIDDELGGYDDRSPVYPSSNSMFTMEIWGSKNIKSSVFNGLNWNVKSLSSENSYSTSYGENLVISRDGDKMDYTRYNPNTNNWTDGVFSATHPWYFNTVGTNSIANKFFLVGNRIYSKKFNSVFTEYFEFLEELDDDNTFSYSNGRNHIFVKQEVPNTIGSVNSYSFQKSELFFMDKTTSGLASIDLGANYHMKNSYLKFGGHTPFLSGNTIYLRDVGTSTSFTPLLYRIIEDEINNWVTDIVASSITIDNAKNIQRKIEYTFEDFHFLANETTFYGKTTIAHKGLGSANNGKIVKYFDNGKIDMRFLGFTKEVKVLDANSSTEIRSVFTPELNSRYYYNSQNINIGCAFYTSTESKWERRFLEIAEYIDTSEDYTYDMYGSLIKTEKTNSLGYLEEVETIYATDSFLRDKNMHNKPKKIIQKNDNLISSTIEIKWKTEGGKVYPYQNWAGVATTKLQKEVTKIDDKGRVLEENNGKGIYSVNLIGYNHRYPVAEIGNTTYANVIANLDVSYTVLQTLTTALLKTELLKLYDKMPKATFSLAFYDDYGNLINKVDSRKEELYYYYDGNQRLSYTTDGAGNILEKKEYHYKR